MSDICINPSTYVTDIFPKGDAQDILNYYLTCEGTNPLQPAINNATYYASYINQTLYSLASGPTAPCPGDPYITATYPYISDINSYVAEIVTLTNCSTIYNIWNSAVNEGLCTDLFTG